MVNSSTPILVNSSEPFDILALTDLKIISDKDARDLLTDVATTHTEAATKSTNPASHQAVVGIVQRILAGRNGVRH